MKKISLRSKILSFLVLGALVITLYLVPKTGIIASVLAISFLNLLFGIILALRRK
jgi:hypothetical protein